jgi:hypothetical protein
VNQVAKDINLVVLFHDIKRSSHSPAESLILCHNNILHHDFPGLEPFLPDPIEACLPKQVNCPGSGD